MNSETQFNQVGICLHNGRGQGQDLGFSEEKLAKESRYEARKAKKKTAYDHLAFRIISSTLAALAL